VDASRALLGHCALAGDEAAWAALVARYAGNPRALQVAAETVGTVFGGDIAAFVAQDVAIFGEIRELLAEQVARLSALEHAVLTWLAEARVPVGFAALVSHLQGDGGRAAVVEAVEALARRGLLECRARGTFTLQPVVLQYVTTQLVARAGAAGQAGVAVGVGHGRGVVQPGATGRAPATWGVAQSGASAAALWARQHGRSLAAVQLPASRRFGRESRSHAVKEAARAPPQPVHQRRATQRRPDVYMAGDR
jgi:hypothetical protein